MSDLDRLRLARAEGVGPITYRRLLARFGNAGAALRALPDMARAGGRAAAPRVPSPAESEAELKSLARLGGRMIFLGEPPYPAALAQLDDAPPALSVLGDVTCLNARAIAMVGARNASVNGRRMAEALAEALAGAGFVVVSGLARGVDAAAHQGALRTGLTVAAVAGGLDCPYPPDHAGLQEAIAAKGAVVAESPLGTQPLSRHFPRRNRIIAGLSLGVVVVEAAPRSGSLITARLANEAGREVFAVPGSPLDPRCRGSNDLLRQGATLIETVDDVLAQLAAPRLGRGRLCEPAQEPFSFPRQIGPEVRPEPGPAADSVRSRVLDLLGPSPCSVDDLVRDCQLPASAVLAALLDLELGGRVEMLTGNRVAALG